jgi:putative methionine-R-sulfoxide reductase with GAF domain
MLFETYCHWCGLARDPSPLADAVHLHEAALRALLSPQALEAVEVRWDYRVPELGEGGACSLFGQLAERPFDLAAALGGRTDANRRRVAQATAVVRYYQAHSRSHWFGIYEAREQAGGGRVLVKLAYFGAESRAEFPLTEDFAQASNNSAVGLSGRGRLINDVAAFVAAGGGYYTCDPKVKSEACLPLFDDERRVVGILDSEAFEPGFFEGDELALILAVAATLSGDLLASGG